MIESPIILKVSKCPLYLDTEFVRNIFYDLDIGIITTLYTELVTNKERTSKGNRLHDTKKTYYKNVYVVFNTINTENPIVEKMNLEFKKDSHLIVNYSSDEFWEVYKCDKIPSFKPNISFSK